MVYTFDDFQNCIRFYGEDVEKNKRFFFKSMEQQSSTSLKMMIRSITGSSTLDLVHQKSKISISFFKESRDSKDIITHTCSEKAE